MTDSPEILFGYFPELSADQKRLFQLLGKLYSEWNERINVISRKDMDSFYERHVLHSLAIAKVFPFPDQSLIVDIGTGGGFPGVPLAILYPECKFVLVDSIGKKIQVVNAVVQTIGLKNVEAINARVESIKKPFDYAVTRAVAPLRDLHEWTRHGRNFNNANASLICLKGGDLTEEFAASRLKPTVVDIASFYTEPFFETKKVVVAPY